MLRRGIATLMIAIMSVASVSAGDAADNQRKMIGWLKPARSSDRLESPVRRATADSSGRAQGEIRQVSDQRLRPASAGRTPQPIQMTAQAVPSQAAVSGPVYYMAGSSAVSNPVPDPNFSGNASGPSSCEVPLNPGTALYPAPIPGVPHQMGGTAISNQFLNPHEMIYAHRYRALYPPYSYKVNGKWMLTPFGVWSHEDWYLQGTMVDVKYKSHISPFAMFNSSIRRRR